jgi:hypothetical protein
VWVSGLYTGWEEKERREGRRGGREREREKERERQKREETRGTNKCLPAAWGK